MFLCKADNGVQYLRSDILPVPHAFSTRIGGVSRLPHTKSLNLAFGHGDDDVDVITNLSRLCDALGLDPRGVVSPPQIHSSHVAVLGKDDRGAGYFRAASSPSDGGVTSERGVTPAVKTADCVPVLLCATDKDGTPLAVGAVHAGWRGTSANIVGAAVSALVGIGCVPSRICAAIGPSIGICCYEVGRDFYDAFNPRLRDRFISPADRKPDKYYADLKGANRFLLTEAGLRDENIDVCELCTACEPTLFYSHRASHGLRGSMLSLISLP